MGLFDFILGNRNAKTPVANLVYASTRRSDVPQLSAFRDLIQKNYKLKEGFLKFPDNTYARGTKITPEVYTALQLAHPKISKFKSYLTTSASNMEQYTGKDSVRD
ncbi:hypothetical protein QL285_089142 [Trifolium repens]|nr:hypothetical protein QL285_089142 [Trifolium repens]